MSLFLYKLARKAIHAMAMPFTCEFFFNEEVGKSYGIGVRTKLTLWRKIRRACSKVTGATSFYDNLWLAAGLLSVPPDVRGDVIECGCFKGRSTCVLSTLCELVDRQLIVCDSFQGLPEPEGDDRVHVALHNRRYESYSKGDYTGPLDEVRSNVKRYGVIDRCQFVAGYFEDTLTELDHDAAFIFLDVDLNSSLMTCLAELWPRLRDHGVLYTHEARQLPFVARFFDESWWRQTHNAPAPGLVGAGVGLPAGLSGSTGMAYAIKLPERHDVSSDPRFRLYEGDPTKPNQ